MLIACPRNGLAGALVVCAALAGWPLWPCPTPELQVSFLDVGQGDAILIRTPAGQQILIDGGGDPDKVCQHLGEKLPFWDKSLDLVVLTHARRRPLVGWRGVAALQCGSGVGVRLLGKGPVYREWLTQIEEKRIDWTIARAGQKIDLGEGIVLEVMYRDDELLEGTESKANSNSVVLRLEWNEGQLSVHRRC